MTIKLPVHMIGEWHHPKYGKIKMDQQKLDEMQRNFAENTIGRKVFVRIGHDKTDKQTFGDAPAEAVVNELKQEGGVLYAFAEPNDENAANLIRSGRYRYISPEYQESYKSKIDGSSKGAALEAIALTNEPFLPGLPENLLLADNPDGYILNLAEVQPMDDVKQLLEGQKETNGLLKKMIAFFSRQKDEEKKEDDEEEKESGGKKPGQKSEESTKQKLADEEMQKKLADMQKEIDAAKAAAALARQTQHAAEVERKLSEYVAKGIPPAVIDNARPILLSDMNQEKTIKLSDDKAISATEQVYSMLENFPESSRVKFTQAGTAGAPPIDEVKAEESRKLAEQAMLELGYKLVDGKFVM